MSGSGNDFIIIDNREKQVETAEIKSFVSGICRRKISAGADGVILVETSHKVDFKWRFYNSDGSIAEMCGNGARCVARFAHLNGISGKTLAFETLAGVIKAEVFKDRVKVRMTNPVDLKTGFTLTIGDKTYDASSANTGVPHVVIQVNDVSAVDVKKLGRAVRFHTDFSPRGTNANFIQVMEDETIRIRTYERGVEDETLACGTGNVAAAILTAEQFGISSPVELMNAGNARLKVYFNKTGSSYTDLYLEGDARVIYKGELWEEAWSDL